MTTTPQRMKRSSIAVLALAALLLGSAGAQPQSTWYVDDDGARFAGCASWEDACPDLQTALGLAHSGDEIRVAQGVYKPTDQAGDRAATFELTDGVAMRGGYLGLSAGKGQDPDERDVGLYETILTGDLEGDDGPNFENNDENSFHVVTADNTNGGTVLDGFTIAGGHAEIFGDNRGGGMHNFNASPTVTHCTFTANAARGDLSRGGAIYNRGTQDNHSAPAITDCTFVGNMVESVGAATTKGWGGAICNVFSDAEISHCTFEENRAVGNVAMGGAVVNSDSAATIIDCTFSGNIATGLGAAGGALGNRGGLGFVPTLVRCAFTENHAVPMDPFNDSIGGALANFSDVKLIDCTLVGNTAAVHGGALYNHESDAELINCLIRENVAGTFDNGSGGAMFNAFDSDPILTNCTLTSGDFSPGFGGGMYNFAGSDPDLSNCILWGNAAGDGSMGGSAQIFNNNDSTPCNPVANFTCIQGGWDGVGNVSDDPLFEDPDGDDFHLQADSPCIDTGSNSAVPEDIITELDGNPRIVDGDGDGDIVVDMGAYESPAVATCTADLDGDEKVGTADLALLLSSWGPCPDCPADLDGDEKVDSIDLATLLANWGSCP